MDILQCRNPTIGAKQSQIVSTRSANFGDGYTQRAYLGINAQRIVRNLEWRVLRTHEAKTLYEWLKTRENVQAFLYTYPGDIERAYIADSVSLTDNGAAPSSVTAKFTENFDVRYRA